MNFLSVQFFEDVSAAADLMLCGSAADLDTACCDTPSSKQLTNVAGVVSAMAAAVVEGGGRPDGAELWMHSICLGSGSGRRMWCVCVLRLLKRSLLWICMFVSMCECVCA